MCDDGAANDTIPKEILMIFAIDFHYFIVHWFSDRISNGNAKNKAIWIDGGIHAREWISPASVTYIVNDLVENWDEQPQHIRNINWYVLPVHNPDGYEYTHRTGKCRGGTVFIFIPIIGTVHFTLYFFNYFSVSHRSFVEKESFRFGSMYGCWFESKLWLQMGWQRNITEHMQRYLFGTKCIQWTWNGCR